MDIKRAYDEAGNRVYVYSVASAIFADDTEKKSVANVIAEQNNVISSINNNISNLQTNSLSTADILNDFIDDDKKVVSASKLKEFYDNSLTFKGILTTQDLDDLTDTGYYLITSATNITNLPTDDTSNYDNSIVVVIANLDNIYQKVIRLKDNIVSTRTKKPTGTFTIPWTSNLTLKATIPNKDKTSLTLPNSYGSLNYFISDGWCTVEFKNIAGNTTNIDIMETTELPIPNLTATGILEADGVMVGSISIGGNDTNTGVKITAHKNSATLGFSTITYKVDQSKY